MAARLERLPFGVGHTSGRWKLWMAVLAAIAILGWYGWYLELSRGMIVTGLRNIGPMGGATWGMDVAFIVYFVGVSFAGITVAALVRLPGRGARAPPPRRGAAR